MVEAIPAKGNIFGGCLPARYILAILGFIGMAIIYGLKVNMSIAMVSMINHTALELSTDDANTTYFVPNNTEVCSPPNREDEKAEYKEDGSFVWDELLQGTILSCYFWGYLVSQFHGGRLSELYSAKWVMLFAVLINIVCTLLTPVLTHINQIYTIVLRILEGMGGGVTFPAMHAMLANWAPPNERSFLSSIIYTGTGFGTAVSILLAGALAKYQGWESIFYVMGGLSCIWVILWVWLVQDTPNKQALISQDERDYINNALNVNKEESKTVGIKQLPWADILTSLPFYAILIAHIYSNWAWYMFLIEIPFYLKQVLKFDIASNAFYTAIPYFIMLVTNLLLSKSLDTLQTKGKITRTSARKIATAIASGVPIICFIALCFIGCRHIAAVVIMSIGIVSMGAMFSGFLTNHIDIAPNYAGTLMAITNCFATVPGIIIPIFVGYITKGDKTINAWRTIFYVTIALLSLELITYTIAGSGNEQKWNKPKKDEEAPEENPLKEQPTNGENN